MYVQYIGEGVNRMGGSEFLISEVPLYFILRVRKSVL